MYNETYDDYIRSILGYPANNFYNNNENYVRQDFNYNLGINNYTENNNELEQCYPEIYKIVYPMIRKKCINITRSVTNDDIENMTDEIYYALEERNETQVNINLTNEVRTTRTNIPKSTEKKAETKITETTGEYRETRQFNRGLRDLIKILLIRELLNRRRRPPFRPPFPGQRPPMRPPFEPGPGRMPFNRDFEIDNSDLFER